MSQLIEPSSQERSEWPDATREYVEGLEARLGDNYYITLWRKTDNVLEWDFHVAFFRDDAERCVANLKKQGVRQFGTHYYGAKVPELSDGSEA